MKLSNLFTKTLREAPSDETAINAKLLIRAGFISKEIAGVYDYLPLGLRVLNKINNIIREEMDATGAHEIFMSVLQNKEVWSKTGRWDSAKEVMYRFKDDSGKEMGLGWTHEEPLTAIAKHFIQSYKDLPRAVYQIQTKFRNEPRVKSGLLRGREFIMKDLYSFHTGEEDLDSYYERVAQAYGNIFKRVGVNAIRTIATGGLFSKYSDEFQVISEVGEDTIFHCEKCSYAANSEVSKDLNIENVCPKCGDNVKKKNSIEAGNIFKLGTRFSEAFGLSYTDEDGNKKPVIMGSYGIGPGRLMATVVEVSNDENGIIWPESVAPYKVHLISISDKQQETRDQADQIYKNLIKKSIEVLYDDREDKTAGEKFADADLIGCPVRIVVSEKTLESKSVEVKKRSEKESKLFDLTDFPKALL